MHSFRSRFVLPLIAVLAPRRARRALSVSKGEVGYVRVTRPHARAPKREHRHVVRRRTRQLQPPHPRCVFNAVGEARTSPWDTVGEGGRSFRSSFVLTLVAAPEVDESRVIWARARPSTWTDHCC